MSVVDLQIGQLSIELIGGETRPSQRFTFTESGAPIPAPEGTWVLVGGLSGEITVPLEADGDDLLAVFNDPQVTAALVGTPLWLKHDGLTKARGRWLAASPQATPRSLTTRFSIEGEGVAVLDVISTPEGPAGPTGPPGDTGPQGPPGPLAFTAVTTEAGTSRTVDLADDGTLILCTSSSPVTITALAPSALPAGETRLIGIRQSGTGQVTITPDGGVTITAVPTRKTRAQGSLVGLLAISTTEWVLIGDVAAI